MCLFDITVVQYITDNSTSKLAIGKINITQKALLPSQTHSSPDHIRLLVTGKTFIEGTRNLANHGMKTGTQFLELNCLAPPCFSNEVFT
jgi:hypothetical protein